MRLALYLESNKISPAEFARLIEVTPATVSRYAAGLRFPEPLILLRIKSATGGAVTADDFLPEPAEARA
jgi:transcriptional regulator with XRE-family HTH domain